MAAMQLRPGHVCVNPAVPIAAYSSAVHVNECKACGRTFNALTGTPMAQLHKRDSWLAYARALVDRVSLRKAAKRVNIHLETSFRWRHRFLATARDKLPSVLSGIIEADETLILKSAKGSRKLVGRAPRKRGGKGVQRSLSDGKCGY